MEEQAKKSFIINVIFVVLWVALGILLGKFLLQYLLPFVISLVIAALMQKPSDKVSLKLGIKKGTVAAIFSAGLYIAVAALITLTFLGVFNITGKFISSVMDLSDSMMNFTLKIKNAFTDTFGKISPEIKDALEKVMVDFLNGITTKITDFLSNLAARFIKSVPTMLFSSVVALAATCYIAKDFDSLKNFLKGLLSKEKIEKIIKIKEIVKSCVFKMLTGYLIIFALTFLEILIGLVVLRVNNAFLIAVLISIVDILPVLGAGTVLLPWGFFNIAIKNTALGFGIIALYAVVVIIRNFTEPKIVGDKTGINPLFMLVAIFLGLRLFGFWGLVILPVTLVVTVKYYKSEM